MFFFEKKNQKTFVFLVAVVTASPALAHHSFAMFDQSKVVTVAGTVKEFQWVNPHVVLWVYANTKDGAVPDLWTIELTSPGNLTRAGWTRHSVTQGDKVAIDIAPLRNGSHGGSLKKLTFTDSGKVLSAFGFSGQEKPGLP